MRRFRRKCSPHTLPFRSAFSVHTKLKRLKTPICYEEIPKLSFARAHMMWVRSTVLGNLLFRHSRSYDGTPFVKISALGSISICMRFRWKQWEFSIVSVWTMGESTLEVYIYKQNRRPQNVDPNFWTPVVWPHISGHKALKIWVVAYVRFGYDGSYM